MEGQFGKALEQFNEAMQEVQKTQKGMQAESNEVHIWHSIIAALHIAKNEGF